MNKQKIIKEDLREKFDSKAQHLKMSVLLNGLIEYIRQDENLPFIVNNMVEYLKEKKDTTIKTIAVAWMIELDKVLHGTRLWESKNGKRRIATHTLPTSGVLDLIKLHYQRNTYMAEPELVESIFRARELTKQEKTDIHMAKMREAKQRKALEREKAQREKELAERRKKAQQEKVVFVNDKTGETKEATEQESAEIAFLKSLNF